jgi:SAM-dependent methyltransferase
MDHSPSSAAIPQAPPLDPRIFPWTHSQLTRRACPVCDHASSRPIVTRPDGLVVARCEVCDLHYLPWAPTADALTAFYAQYSTDHQSWQGRKTPAMAIKSANRRRGGNGLLAEIARLRPLSGAAVVELGCSRGSFLLDARAAGAVTSGMEIDVGAQQFVRALGMPCHATLDEVAKSGPYDIVVALNLIEHLMDARPWLQTIHGMLNPGGLLVLWTPNGGQADLLGAGWVGFRVDLDHLMYFSMKSLARVVTDTGFWPESAWEFGQANLGGFRRGTPAPGRAERLVATLRRSPVPSWNLPRGAGGYTLALLAGKPGA